MYVECKYNVPYSYHCSILKNLLIVNVVLDGSGHGWCL